MNKIFTFVAILLLLQQGISQKEIWSLDVAKDAYLSQIETGQLLIKEKGKITLLNHRDGKLVWTNNVDTDKDPIFLDNLPLFYFTGNSYAVIDAVSGKILEKDEQKTDVLKVHYYWAQNKVILEQERNNNLYITCLDLKNNKAITTNVAPIKKSMFGLVKNTTSNKPSITDEGTIILVDKKAVTIIDVLGKIKHRTDFEENLEKIDFNPSNNFLYVREEKKLHFVNTLTGKIESTAKLDDDDFSFNIIDDGKIFALRDGKKLTLMDASNGKIIINKKYDDKIKYTYLDPETNKYYLCIDKSIVEIDQRSAETIRSNEVSKGIGQIYTVRDRVFFGDNYKSNEIDLTTLKARYAKPIPLHRVSDYITVNDNNLYIDYVSNSIYMLDKTGAELWNKKFGEEKIQSLDLAPAGLLVITDIKADLLNVNTGKSLLKKDIQTGPAMVFHLNEKTNVITFYSQKKIKILDLNNGAYKESKKELEFKDFDYATQIPQMNINEKYIYLKGSNSIFITDPNGNILYEKNYKKTDNTSALLKLATVAVTAAAISSGNADKVLTVYSGNKQVHKGEYVDGLNNLYNYSEELAAKRQRQQNRSSAVLPYVHTKLEGNNERGLIFIDPETGNHKHEVIMPEKDPNYIVDEIDSLLFYISKSKLTAVALN